MAWFFELAAEFGLNQEDAEIFAVHFQGLNLSLVDHASSLLSANIWQASDDNWWCRVCPGGVSRSGIGNRDDAKQMTEIGILLYGHLRSAPSFRFALVGVETEECISYSELIDNKEFIIANSHFNGLVINHEIWDHFEQPPIFEPFKDNYFWKPYKGEMPPTFWATKSKMGELYLCCLTDKGIYISKPYSNEKDSFLLCSIEDFLNGNNHDFIKREFGGGIHEEMIETINDITEIYGKFHA